MSRSVSGACRSVWVLVVAGAVGCNCGPTISDVKPWFEVDNELVDFGLVALGDSVEGTPVDLIAKSSAEVTVSVRIEGDGAAAFTFKEPPPTFLGGNSSTPVIVVFAPTDDTTYAATLVVESNGEAPGIKTARILLAGEGKRPQISVKPAQVRLTAVACTSRASPPAACVDQQLATIENVGLVDLRLGRVDLVGATDGVDVPANLRLGANDASSKLLAPGESVTVPIRWQPAVEQAGEHVAALLVESNDPEQPSVKLPIAATATPNAKPNACINVLSVQRRSYERDLNGAIVVRARDVPTSEWSDPERPGVLLVRPGYILGLSSKKADATAEENDPCTFDPEGDSLSYTWSFTQKPAESRVLPNPAGSAATSFEVDAEGTFELTLAVRDGVNTGPGLATLTIDAVPKDDLFVSLSWQDESATGVDLDLHLVVDRGPHVPGAGDLFCQQDAFVFQPNPRWFEDDDCFLSPPGPNCTESLENDPVYRMDDNGNGPRQVEGRAPSQVVARTEFISLASAPDDARFRVAVHYFGGVQADVTPVLKVRLKGTEFGPFRPSSPLSQTGDVWFGATLTFPPAADPPPLPTASALQVRFDADQPGYPYPTDLLGIDFATAVCQ